MFVFEKYRIKLFLIMSQYMKQLVRSLGHCSHLVRDFTLKPYTHTN